MTQQLSNSADFSTEDPNREINEFSPLSSPTAEKVIDQPKKLVVMPFVKYGGLKFLEENGDNDIPLCIVSGTGSGKSTTIAKFYADRAQRLNIRSGTKNGQYYTIILVPGRAAARSLYTFMTQTYPGAENMFAYSIGKETNGPNDAPVRFVTAGWAFTKLHDPSFSWLNIVIDEAHDPSRDYYNLRKICKYKLRAGAKFKLIVCSATIAAAMFNDDFPGLKTFDLDTLSNYKNDIIYHDQDPDGKSDQDHQNIAKETMRIHAESPYGDKLVFCDGERTVVNVASILEKHLPSTRVCTLYGAMETSDIQEILEFNEKVVTIYVVTNMVESSITIPRITHVICSGIQKTMYIDGTGRKDLRTEFCSQSSLLQQRGRGMRTNVYDPDGQLIIGHTFMMFTKEKWDLLYQSSPREVDTSSLHTSIIELLDLGYDPTEIMDDISPRRIANDMDYLFRYDILKKTADDSLLPSQTPLGIAISSITADIPNARILYIAAKSLINTGHSDMVWYVIFMIAKASMTNGPFHYPRRSRESTPAQWKAFREEFTEEHFTQYFGQDDMQSSLTIYRRYKQKLGNSLSTCKNIREWIYSKNLSANFFDNITRTIRTLTSDLQKLGLQFQNKDCGRTYEDISTVLWPIISELAGTFEHCVGFKGKRVYRQKLVVGSDDDRKNEAKIHYSIDHWNTIDEAVYGLPTSLVAFQVRSIRMPGKSPFYTISNIFSKGPQKEESSDSDNYSDYWNIDSDDSSYWSGDSRDHAEKRTQQNRKNNSMIQSDAW
jgi:HrpA-like RNA helicase